MNLIKLNANGKEYELQITSVLVFLDIVYFLVDFCIIKFF